MGEEPRGMTEVHVDAPSAERNQERHAEPYQGRSEERMEEHMENEDFEQEVGHLEEEIAETRERLGLYLSELDHRRHRMMKLVRRGGGLVLGVSAVAIAAMMIFRSRSQEDRNATNDSPDEVRAR